MRAGYDMSLSIRVKELLDEGTPTQIMAQVKSDLEEEWVTTLPEESSKRELLYHELHCLSKLDTRIKSIVQDLLMQEEKY